MPTIEYTELWVLDGNPNHAGGAVVQHWVAINAEANTRTTATTYDGSLADGTDKSYALVEGWQNSFKSYTKVTGNSIPPCFKKVGETAPLTTPVALTPVPAIISITQPEATPPIALKHPITISLNFEDIATLTDSRKLSTFIGQIDNVARGKHPYDNDAKAKCKGDIFEIFVEFLIKYQGRDPRIGITDYAIQQATDFGVDGVGKSTKNNKPTTVQAKYRQFNHAVMWNDDHIANFYNQSRLQHFDPIRFIPEDGANMLLITSANEVHYKIAEFCGSKIRYITHDGLVQLTNGMATFWEEFARALKAAKPQGPTTTDKTIKGKKLREHQQDAVIEAMGVIGTAEPRLTIELPTGTGKTLIQAEIIRLCWKEKGFGCALIVSPTILLTYQHLTEIAGHLTANGIDAEYLNISSGEFDDETIRRWKADRGMDASYIESPPTAARSMRNIKPPRPKISC